MMGRRQQIMDLAIEIKQLREKLKLLEAEFEVLIPESEDRRDSPKRIVVKRRDSPSSGETLAKQIEAVLIAAEGQQVSLRDISQRIGSSYPTVSSTLNRMMKSGAVEKVERGFYRLMKPAGRSPQNGANGGL